MTRCEPVWIDVTAYGMPRTGDSRKTDHIIVHKALRPGPPAMGHLFGENLRCAGCGTHHEPHQINPQPCPFPRLSRANAERGEKIRAGRFRQIAHYRALGVI